MKFHKDLNLYTNKSFRSFDYLQKVWEIIEFELIYIIGMINVGNITLSFESDIIYITATSNFKKIFQKEFLINFNHSLCLCYDFVTDITINIVNSFENFYFDSITCKFYFDKKTNLDEGFLECVVTVGMTLSDINSFKKNMFITLAKELQHVINKNVLSLNIENNDMTISDIDSLYEVANITSSLENISFEEALKNIDISNKDKKTLKSLRQKILNL